jgi:hypothetical protein
MNWADIVNGILRAVTPAIIAWLVARNLTEEVAGNLVRYAADTIVALITLASATWSVRKNLVKNQVANVIARDDVMKVELAPELAATVKAAAPKYAGKVTTTAK